ncbi:MAG: lysophospholipid acyltransferase family protein [bacterium]|uniref:1-acylglycerol-3-phosphate O-acyltransferase n=2 Tax=Bacteria candidate phyla TaxID=1783234 RepID=A0A101I3F0_UNCT6|nr:MAG: 1-acylglycerol-3-phosphate O-acyltransferase [candidate division TA06 bacterium 32_111]KUK87935.1 MAG: 1-acylglycerol-3-phosphate O-acyltransferase [candidate division TA06 bacterium 34_109]MDI6700536.1 lysophospholipid acyltransferase family protein [bacterium]HAF08088.1 1-acyl-sn-glycerol-3-phosphate acyltransferase [candidate division WOR-3 bacterium]HCP16211.1 1-acyl-sn-glycerol-3-phosphate acyltransferase [candidate division WOR-3 bacterium]
MLSRRRRSARQAYNFIYFLANFYYHFLLGTKIKGKIRLKEKKLILVANHRSFNDPPLIGTFAYSFRRSFDVYLLAKKELFHINPFFTKILKLLHAIPLDRTGMDATAIKEALDALERENYLVIFPEGTRNKTDELLEGKSGVGYIALKSGAKIVPIFLKNTDKPFLRQLLRLDRIELIVGEPIILPQLRPNSKNSKIVTSIIMKELKRLKDENSCC